MRAILTPSRAIALAALLGFAAPLLAQAPLSSITAINAINNVQASAHLPVSFEATVTFPRPAQKNLFVMDGDRGCYVRWPVDQGLLPGDRVRITGTTAPSFRPIVSATAVTFLHHGDLPPAYPATFADLIQSKWDARRVTVTGRVLSAALDDDKPAHSLRVRVRVPEGTVEGIISHPGTLTAADLLDADVSMTGVAGGEYDSKMQMAGIWLDMNYASDLVILHHPFADPWTAPAIPMDSVIGYYRFSNQSNRVRITGTLTYYEPGVLAVLEQRTSEEKGRSMLVKTNTTLPMHTGSFVEATGFPAVSDASVRLDNAQIRPTDPAPAVQSQPIQWDNASVGHYAFDLVSMEGEVVGAVHDSRVDLLLIESEGHLFSATLRHSSSDLTPGDLANPPQIAIGSRVRVTGVCFVENGNHWRDRLWFDLRMRSPADIALLQPPSWWTVKHAAYIIIALAVAVLFSALWVSRLDRRLRAKTAALARQSQEEAIRERVLTSQEQQRSRILERISSSVPLPDVLEEIQSMVAARLSGAPCWFALVPSVGGCCNPERPTDPSLLFRELTAQDGSFFGYLVARPRWVHATQEEADSALTTGARLAQLAIQTRRLYADLRHRSEYDQLTEVPNRFAMERRLAELMDHAVTCQQSFGLIYVDLDRFKQVNDRFGHRIGDLYLQTVTRRMQLQLRSEDFLARIGGDEFIVLVTTLISRTEAEEIIFRLNRCFDQPFQLEGHVLLGSASFGLALYPEDGLTSEVLQRTADAAMYHHKQSHRQPQPA